MLSLGLGAPDHGAAFHREGLGLGLGVPLESQKVLLSIRSHTEV